jgi:O-antigen/teichoic acid export membrane protein
MESSKISFYGKAAMPLAAPSLRITFTWTLVGNVVYALCQWGMISALARLGTTAAVGQFALALAITAPVFMLTYLWLRAVQATDARSEFEFANYFTLRVTSTVLALGIVVGIALVARYDAETRMVVVLIGAAKAVESFTDVIAGLLQKNERLDQVAIGMMLKGSLSVAVFSATYFYWRSVPAAAASLCVTWLLVFLGYDLQLARRILRAGGKFFCWNSRRLLHLAKLAAPLGIVGALSTLNSSIPRYALEHYRGASEVGIFSALAYLVVVMTVLVNALAQSAVVRLSRYFAAGLTSEFSRLLMQMASLCAVAACLGVALCKVIGYSALRLLYGGEYAAHVALLQLFIATSGIIAIAAVLSFGMTAARRFRAQVPVLAATLVTCAVFVWALTPRWGMAGAATAMLFSALVQATGGFLVVRDAVRKVGITEPNLSDATVLPESLAVVEEFVQG